MKYLLSTSLILIIVFSLYNQQKKANFNHEYTNSKAYLLAEIEEDKKEKRRFLIAQTFAEKKKEIIKNNVDLEVQFYPQSPFWKWGPIFEDTCEEASVLLALNYIRGDEMTREEFRDELLDMVDWQNEIFWDYKDTDVEQTAYILKKYFDFSNYDILEKPSLEDIKRELSNENIIIAPLFWAWFNPNYTWVWPDYHFVVIKWYDEENFIIHDVGTKQWEDYTSSHTEVLERLHDFHETDIRKWEKKLIVLKKDD